MSMQSLIKYYVLKLITDIGIYRYKISIKNLMQMFTETFVNFHKLKSKEIKQL